MAGIHLSQHRGLYLIVGNGGAVVGRRGRNSDLAVKEAVAQGLIAAGSPVDGGNAHRAVLGQKIEKRALRNIGKKAGDAGRGSGLYAGEVRPRAVRALHHVDDGDGGPAQATSASDG